LGCKTPDPIVKEVVKEVIKEVPKEVVLPTLNLPFFRQANKLYQGAA
jgi:hypothetical protein